MKALTHKVGLGVTAHLLAACLAIGACNDQDEPGDQQQQDDKKVLQCGSAELYLTQHDECEAMDAQGGPDEEGDCLCILGWAFDGNECVSLSNCQCTGEDCDKLTQTKEECEAQHQSCLVVSGISCGESALYSLEHDQCSAMDAAASGDENGHCDCMLGYAWDGTECVGLGDCMCVGSDCDKLTETIEECEAQHTGCDETKEFHCGDPQMFALIHDECGPMDATAAGDENGHCDCWLGYTWDGDDCVGLGDCMCVGSDCDKLTETYEECIAEHSTCFDSKRISCGSTELFMLQHDDCTAMDATGDEQCFCALGYAFDGTDCVMLGGCECIGADCDKLTETYEECQAEHVGC